MFRKLCDVNGIERIIAVATAAVRRAKNQRSFLDEVSATCGIKLRVLSAEEEALYVYRGVINTMDIQHQLMLCCHLCQAVYAIYGLLVVTVDEVNLETCDTHIGIVLAVEEKEDVSRLKPVVDVKNEDHTITPYALSLIKHLKETTFCTWYEAVKTVIPYGALYKIEGQFLSKQLVRHTKKVYCDSKTNTTTRL